MMNCNDVYALLGDEGHDPVSLDGSVVSSPRCSSPSLMTGLESISPSLNIKIEPNIAVGNTASTQAAGGICSNVNYNSTNITTTTTNNNFNNNNVNHNNASQQIAGVSGLRVGTRRKSEWTDESSEYNYAKALLDQASSFGTSPDLDRSSVLRLAQAYINLQQGLQSWENCGHRLELWPPFVHAGRLALNTQESLGCFVLIVTGHGTVVYVSDAIETLLGHDQINLVGRSIQNLIHPEEMSVLATQFSLVTGAGQVPSSRSFYTRMLNAEKSNASRQVFELIHVIGHLQEVALASSSDRTIDQKETWLMCACKVMAHVPEKEGPCSPFVEWVTHNELNGKIIDIDPRSCQVTGYLPSEMVGLSPYCLIHADDQEHVAFFHNQALFDAEGASTYYRMYTSSHEIVFVHTTMQLSTDKLTNRPKSLFCIHQVVGEKEGSDQILQHQQLVMWSKADPSSKFSMADIELMVKALEDRGVASRNIPSKGGMMNSRLSDSCTLDGADLLNRNLSQILTVPSFSENLNAGEAMSHGMRQSSRGHGRTPYARMNSPYHHRSQQQMQQQHQQQQLQQQQHQNLYSPISPIGSAGSSSSIGDPWSGKSQQRSQKGYRHHQLHQQSSMVSPTQSRPGFQHQISFSSASPLSAGGSTPHPDSPVSFIDFLNESGPQSTPTPDSKSLYSEMPAASSLTVGVKGRGRGRSRGRPRGSGRGARGLNRGAGRPRGTRGGRGRGRGRGNSESLTQLRDVMGNVQKMNTNVGHGSLSPGRGRAHQGLTHMRHSLSTEMNTDMASQIRSNSSMSQGDITPQAGASPFQALLGEDEGMLKRNSLDDLDFLDNKGSFEMQRIPSMELMSPVSLSSQDSVPNMQISPYQSYNETDIKEGGQHAYRKHNIGGPDIQQSGSYFQEPKMSSSFDMTMGTTSQYSSQNSMTSSSSTGRRRGQLQHSLSLQGSLETQIGQESDVEHSILGNLLKGRGGSTSTTGSKSPVQSLGLDKGSSSPNQALQSNRWSPSHAGGGNKAKWIVNPMSTDRDGKSFSEASSPASVFSPEASVSTPTTPKGGQSPHLGSQGSSKMSHHTGPSVQKASPLPCDNVIPPGEPGMSKAAAEMQVFSAQLRHKHKTLEDSLVFQEKFLRHLESNMHQASPDMDGESFYAHLNARLDNLKVNTMAKKVKQEEELRSLQAKFESQVKAHTTESPQHQPLQTTSNTQPQQPGAPLQPSPLSNNPVDTQPRLHLTSPASQNHRRMAIVPPIQRQISEQETMSLSQSNTSDLKSSSVLDSQCSKESRLESLSPPLGSKGSDNFSKIKKQHQNTSAVATSRGTSSSQATAMVNQVPQPQPSPYSLHHHHHHHHHYHHQIPLLPGQPPPSTPRGPHSQQTLEFPRAGKVTPPPPPYGHMDIFPPVSSAAMPSPATSLAQTALNISVPSLSSSLTSPIVCDTSPISVDESPSCASDTSSGYHSLSLSADPTNVSASGSFTKPHEGTSVVSGILYQSKTPPTSTFHAKMGTTPELLPGTGDFNPSASS